MKTIFELTPEQLRKAAQIKEQIASLEKQMQALLGQSATPSKNNAPVAKAAGGVSAATRARISEAMRARWAKVKASKAGQAAAKPAARPAQSGASKRKPMSAAQKAKIAETMRARWAKVKSGKK